MLKLNRIALLSGTACIALLSRAGAEEFNIPGGDMKSALDAYAKQARVQLIYSDEAVKDARTKGMRGDLPPEAALSRLLSGSGLTVYRRSQGVLAIIRDSSAASEPDDAITPLRLAQAAPPRATVETVTVTSSKLGGADVQSIPIAITALSQEQLTSRQIAGGPDLIKEVPNLTFTKTNFTGYSIQIRGIGTQAISVTTDPAVAVSFNDTPFIRNHFFEQEFYDVAQVEVLRGPQGTLYGRNATAGVVNVTSAVPTDQFEAMGSVDLGNYQNRRFEGMINLPVAGDKLMLRIAGEWTKRNGYSFNSLTDSAIDGRDLWSGRATVRWQPSGKFHTDLVWEHFQEDDGRLRSAKQLCERGAPPQTILGQPTTTANSLLANTLTEAYLNQVCLPGSLYSPDAFGVPDSVSLPYYGGVSAAGINGLGSPLLFDSANTGAHFDAYAGTTQSHNLRVIESTLDPKYKARNDTLELNTEWNVTPSLALHSETAYNRDFLWSTEDYNRFNTQPGIFKYDPTTGWGRSGLTTPDGNYRCGFLDNAVVSVGGNFCAHPSQAEQTAYFCDPQLGCSNRLVAEDLSEEHAWQLSQELRLSSDFKGPLNFSFGGNFMHYETEENYYVFINTLTMFSALQGLTGRAANDPWVPFVSDNGRCLYNGHQLTNPGTPTVASNCLGYIDPNPITSLNNEGHNYFLSQNPYNLNSYAGFGEMYYNVTNDLKLTAGLRWTDDQKHFVEIPSELLTTGYGYPVTGTLDQEWKEFTGRFVANWTPKVSFTDQTMLYASYAHGYKAGGANPPGAVLLTYGMHGDTNNPVHPKTFDPEFNDAFELGSKNTLFDGAVTFNTDAFYYDYKGYQISQIVDRTAINLNFNATSWGAEVEATWEPVPGLKFGFNGGYERTRLVNGSQAVDLMDRTAGNPNWIVVKPFVTQASNCIIPAYVIGYLLNPAFQAGGTTNNSVGSLSSLCGVSYGLYQDPITGKTYSANPTGSTPYQSTIDPSYPGFDPAAGNVPGDPYHGQNTYNGIDYGSAPNNGQGFFKNLSGNELPNAPHYTMSLTADYTVPVTPDWAATLHSDFYWQSESWARVYNDDPYDRLRGYTNLNLALILTDDSGWQVMGYLKNVFNTTAITGTFLNSDDSGLTTNIFLTDPRLFGVRVTKHFDGGNSGGGGRLADGDGKLPTLWVTVGGNFNNLLSADNETYYPDYIRPGGANLIVFRPSGQHALPGAGTLTQLMAASGFSSPDTYEVSPHAGFDWEGKLAIQPQGSDWVLKAGIRYGRSGINRRLYETESPGTRTKALNALGKYQNCALDNAACRTNAGGPRKFVNANGHQSEQHAVMDFETGVNIGIGMFGKSGSANISGGIRMAQFTSQSNFEINSDPDYFFHNNGSYHNIYEATGDEERSFHGVGPEVTWDANQTVLGSADNGEVTIDWGVNAAMLFGRQSVNAKHFTSYCHINGLYNNSAGGLGCATGLPGHSQTKETQRTRRKVVPNLGGYIGASARYQNAKLSFGYRADTFFGAMDGGQETAKDYNRGFYGPYMNVSIGLGN